MPVRVKSERHPPRAIAGIETKLFHIRVPGTVQRIRIRPTQLRTKRLQQLNMGEQLVLDIYGQQLMLTVKLGMKSDYPTHAPIMLSKSYAVNDTNVNLSIYGH